MKIRFLVFLVLVSSAFGADQGDRQLVLGYQMQEAVLRTRDVRKVQELLDAGIDINAPIGCGNYSPLDGAVQTQNVEMLKFLLAHRAQPRGHELADAAFASGHQQALEMVQTLLDAGVPPDARNDHSTALIEATYRENLALVRLLLTQPGIKLDAPDNDGDTALMWAVKHGSSEIVDLLLGAGASTGFTNQWGQTAKSLAQQEIEKQRAIISRLESAPR